jgi:hypothetical protein
MIWTDSNGLRVDFLILTLVGDGRGEHGRTVKPIDGPQFHVTRAGFFIGQARTAGELRALGVDEATVAEIETLAETDDDEPAPRLRLVAS